MEPYIKKHLLKALNGARHELSDINDTCNININVKVYNDIEIAILYLKDF